MPHVYDKEAWVDGQAHCVLCGLPSDRWDVPCDPTYPDEQSVDGYGYCPQPETAVDGYCPKCGDLVIDPLDAPIPPYPFSS